MLAVEEKNLGDSLAAWIFLSFCALIILAQLVPLCRQLWRRSRDAEVKQAAESPEARGE
jgi:hypothetical protein